MDCVIPTHDRPVRLACTLSTLLTQQWDGPHRLYIVDNSQREVCTTLPVSQILDVFSHAGWEVYHQRSTATSITQVKLEALQCGTAPYLVLIDNDILFTRADTLKALYQALQLYAIAAISPVAYDVDDQRPVLTPYIDAYNRYPVNEHGLLEGTIALGPCLAMVRSEVNRILKFWQWKLPYMEDQVLVHFLKAQQGYAYLREHRIFHCGRHESPSYAFDDNEVIRHLESLTVRDEHYQQLLDLRRALKDGADFPKRIIRR